MPQQRWQLWPAQPQLTVPLAEATGLSPLLAQVLVNRGVDSSVKAAEYLEPERQQLPSPLSEFLDLASSLDILVQAIETQQKIAICGDYDADGMTSTALLLRALRSLGAVVDYAIPSRMSEGYGINERIVEEFHAEGVSVILTVDNGIAAVAPIARARQLGLAVIVTDHHDIPPEIPPANAILNPKLLPETSPYRGVAGVGVAYILAICLAQMLGKTQDLTAPLLELFTLGTIADLAPLTGVNRRWVRRGLKLLARSRLLGVQALVQVAGLSDQDKALKPEHIGFRLGPRINAVGRLSDPQVVIEMLTTDDVGVALERAIQCEQINQTRQDLCQQIEQAAIAWCEAQQQAGTLDLSRERVLVVVQPDWHHGVIGIVASRLVERYGVPVFIGTYEDAAQKEIRGSARGIAEFNVFEALQACSDLMTKFGGHRAAGGFSFAAKRLRQVKARLSNYARQHLAIEHLKPLVKVDAQANLAEITMALYDQIDQLHPCGMENPDPVFWTPAVTVLEQQCMGRGRDHLKLQLRQVDQAGRSSDIKAIAWRWGEYCPLPAVIDVAYKLKLNEWQGQRSVELELVGVRLPAAASAAAKSAGSTPSPQPASSPPEPLRPPQATALTSFKVMREAAPPELVSKAAAALPVPEPGPTAAIAAQDWSRAEFFYSKRRYSAQVSNSAALPASQELIIQNPEGQQLVVVLPERQGFLCVPGDPARPVDLSEPYYFNLLRAGLSALEVKQTTRLLLEKDELLTEKDDHIATLTRQVALLEQKLSQLSSEQRQQFQTLQQELVQQESAIQSQEAHIAQLQSQMGPTAPRLDLQAIKRQVRQTLGDKVWYCLSQPSQKDLYTAYKHQALMEADTDAALADYSEAGLRLGAAAEREVTQPFFSDLYSFLQAQGSPEIGSLLLGPQKKFTLGMLPPLLAQEWSSFRPEALQAESPPGLAALYAKANAGGQMGSRDRERLRQFLQQWDHPMARWLNQAPIEAASRLDQISQLCNLAAHGENRLCAWQYQLLTQQLVGSGANGGLFQLIYAA